MKYAILAVLVTLFTLGAAQDAPANPDPRNCAPLDAALAGLKADYDEIPIVSMTTKDKLPLRLWGNLSTGTWTLFFVAGDEAGGTFGCLVDSGDGLRVGR